MNKNDKTVVLKRIDPRMKLYILLFYLIIAFFAEGWIGLGLNILSVAGLFFLSKIQIRKYWEKMKWVLLILFVIALLFAASAGIIKGLFFFVKLVVAATAILIYREFSGRYDRLDAVFYGFHTSQPFAVILSCVFGYLPSLGKSMRELLLAAQYRGANTSEMKFLEKAKIYFYLFIPAFQRSFLLMKHKKETAELRCFDLEMTRKRMKPLKMKGFDYLAAGIAVLYGVLVISLRIIL